MCTPDFTVIHATDDFLVSDDTTTSCQLRACRVLEDMPLDGSCSAVSLLSFAPYPLSPVCARRSPLVPPLPVSTHTHALRRNAPFRFPSTVVMLRLLHSTHGVHLCWIHCSLDHRSSRALPYLDIVALAVTDCCVFLCSRKFAP